MGARRSPSIPAQVSSRPNNVPRVIIHRETRHACEKNNFSEPGELLANKRYELFVGATPPEEIHIDH